MENRVKTKTSKEKYILYTIFIIYTLMLIKIVLFKMVSITEILKGDISPGFRSVNLIPFKTVSDFMEIKDTNLLRAFSNIIGNIGIFMPLGYLLPLLFKKFNNLSKVILLSISISIVFELMQYLFYLGSMDIDDIILNTIGGTIGYFTYDLLKGFIVDQNKIHKVSIILSVAAFITAFTIAKEEFGNLLGLTTHEVITKGEENIPKRQPDINGTYLSIKDSKLEMYKGIISENSTEKEFLDIITTQINDDTELYYMSFKEESKNKSIATYTKLSKEELSKIEPYSLIKIWKDNQNDSVASVIVLSKKSESQEGSYISSKNSNEGDEQLLNGNIEKIDENGIVINLIITQELEDGSTVGISGRDKNSNLVNVKFKDNTKFKIHLITSSGDLIESKDCKKEELETKCSVKIKGFKEGKYFIAKYIEMYKIVK